MIPAVVYALKDISKLLEDPVIFVIILNVPLARQIPPLVLIAVNPAVFYVRLINTV